MRKGGGGEGGWEGWTFFVCAEGSVGGLVGDFVEEFVHFAFFVLGLFWGVWWLVVETCLGILLLLLFSSSGVV